MFDQLLALVNLGEKLPEAIGWSYDGPYKTSLPEEFLTEISDSITRDQRHLLCSYLTIYNYSGQSKSEVRILYSGEFRFKPIIFYQRRKALVKWDHNEDNKEITIFDVPPNESVNITLCWPYNDFRVDQVLVDDKLITELMKRRALARAYPELQTSIWAIAISALLLAAGFCVLIYLGYLVYGRYQDQKLLEQATDGVVGCTLSIYENPPNPAAKEMLNRKIKKLEPWMVSLVLKKNNVYSIEDLHDLDKIILCSPER
ncbi:hypothetical protein ACMSIO_21100 [Pseudomonas benzopyrenica]|uniref:hypothetical protein n=1 Tax=Pseudomonas benzopyrenica TaxID=2993566 RepID=UPI0039C07EC1